MHYSTLAIHNQSVSTGMPALGGLASASVLAAKRLNTLENGFSKLDELVPRSRPYPRQGTAYTQPDSRSVLKLARKPSK